MFGTIVSPMRGLQLVGNEILLLLSRKRISKDSKCLTKIILSKVVCALLKSQTMPSCVAFSTEFAWISVGLILFCISRCSNLLFGVALLRWFLFRRSSLVLILLVPATRFLCRLHRFYHSGWKSSNFGRRVDDQLGNGTTDFFYSGPKVAPTIPSMCTSRCLVGEALGLPGALGIVS